MMKTLVTSANLFVHEDELHLFKQLTVWVALRETGTESFEKVHEINIASGECGIYYFLGGRTLLLARWLAIHIKTN